MDLRKVTPRFSTVEEIPNDVDVSWLIAEFSGYAEAIATAIDVDQVIKDALF
jgi:hypothetical protein